MLPEQNAWVHNHQVDLDVAAIFDPFGNAVHTALSFPVLGEDVLITGAGPIGLMAAAVAKHAGARHVAITDVSEPRLDLARKIGVDLALNVATTRIADVYDELRMTEGFDIGMEMSGQPAALRDMIANMTHGGRIAMLGLPATEIPINWSHVVLKMLTIKGIYGREMFETWYAMSVLLQAGLDISPVITHRFPYTEHEAAFATARDGRCGKVIMDWRRPDVRRDAGEPAHGAGRDPLRRPVQGGTGDLDPAERVGPGRLRRRGAELLRQQLPRARRPPGAGRRRRRRRWTAGVSGWRRCGSSAGRRSRTRSSRPSCRSSSSTEDTILYSSCFDANAGLFETLLGKDDAVISDELNHASVIDGVRLCKAQRLRYKNRDMADLERQLKEAAGARYRLIATDGVFSMDGYLAPLDEICALADRYDALVMVDDSHAVGFTGPTGRGTPELFGVADRVDVVTGTLGKALGGASGGYTSGRAEIVEMLRQRSRPYLFSNSLAPSITATALAALTLLESSSELLTRLQGEHGAVPVPHDRGRVRPAARRAPDHPGDDRRRGARGPDGRPAPRRGHLRDRVLLPGGAARQGTDPDPDVGRALDRRRQPRGRRICRC